jgi:hypothetical protein
MKGHTLTIRVQTLTPVNIRCHGRCACGEPFRGPNGQGWDEPVEIGYAYSAHIRDVERGVSYSE